jgi:putative glutamine amidotransferase
MSKKPTIAFNGDFRPARKDVNPLSWYNTGYYDSITAAGGLPMPLPPFADDADLNQFLDHVDGLVLSGCTQDMNPQRLGMEPHPTTRAMPTRREDFDRRLCKIAYERRIPVLAVGLGMQMLNVVCGGTIYQHIAEAYPRPMHHFDPVEKNLRHIIEIVPETRMDEIYGPGEIRINSSHHQSVDQLATPFRASATAPDGVIEAYESILDDWYCLGMQWHPESETSSALDMQVFQHFLQACTAVEQPMILQLRHAA